MDLFEALKLAGEQTSSSWETSETTEIGKGNDKYEHIYLQLNSIGEFQEEESLLIDYFGRDAITPFYLKKIEQGDIVVTEKDFASGEVPTMQAILDRLGVDYTYNDYPESIRKYMHRKLWSDNLGNVKRSVIKNDFKPIFVKPKDGLKKFTGFVLNSENDFYKFKNASDDMEVWCCEPVKFISEYRIPVINGEIRDCCYYVGEKTGLDMSVVEAAVKDFKECNKAYCIDFGVLSTGETALIEVNDAYGIGCYTMNPETYAELLMTRWDELMESRNG